jgi:hypothetical protein
MGMTHTMNKFPINVWEWSETIKFINYEYPHRIDDFAKSFSENQFNSKTWLVEKLKMNKVCDKANKEIWILGSWYGTLLVPLLYKNIPSIQKIHLVDYDYENLMVAKYMFGDSVKLHVNDVTFDFDKIRADIIINTSCEHMYPMESMDLSGFCVFQSNNYDKEPAHINCVNSIEDFVKQSGIKNVEYSGEIPFHKVQDDYKRFMVMGQR